MFSSVQYISRKRYQIIFYFYDDPRKTYKNGTGEINKMVLFDESCVQSTLKVLFLSNNR